MNKKWSAVEHYSGVEESEGLQIAIKTFAMAEMMIKTTLTIAWMMDMMPLAMEEMMLPIVRSLV